MPKKCIRIAGLKEGEHRQEFEIKNKFFQAYEYSDVKAGDFIVETLLIIRGLDRKLRISIEGIITNFLCDYCVQKLEWPITTTSNFVIKESEKEMESTDEVIYVLPNQYQLVINQLIFEMINLSVPTKRTHDINEKGELKCDKEMLTLIDKYATKTKQEIDPRWEVLNKLK
jgi:uncharacterized metal-binding protein YceD (DUF177 family)